MTDLESKGDNKRASPEVVAHDPPIPRNIWAECLDRLLLDTCMPTVPGIAKLIREYVCADGLVVVRANSSGADGVLDRECMFMCFQDDWDKIHAMWIRISEPLDESVVFKLDGRIYEGTPLNLMDFTSPCSNVPVVDAILVLGEYLLRTAPKTLLPCVGDYQDPFHEIEEQLNAVYEEQGYLASKQFDYKMPALPILLQLFEYLETIIYHKETAVVVVGTAFGNCGCFFRMWNTPIHIFSETDDVSKGTVFLRIAWGLCHLADELEFEEAEKKRKEILDLCKEMHISKHFGEPSPYFVEAVDKSGGARGMLKRFP